MQVLMLSDVYFPRVNGVSTSIQTFQRCLGNHGVTLRLLAPDYGGTPAAGESWIDRVPARRVPFDPEDRLARRRDMVLAARPWQPDLVHIQTPFAAHYAGLEVARARKIPVVATYHTLFEEYLHHYVPVLPRAITRPLARRLSRQQCNALDAVLVPSTAMAERLREYGVTVPLRVQPTGIPLDRFGSADGAAFRQRHGISADRRVALYVGRVAHEKNIDFLLRVARCCRDNQPDLLWLIAGEGPALNDLKALARQLGIESEVRFVGYLDRADALPACYAAADVFVFASRTETQGLVLLEAMASARPVVALACLGTTDIVGPRQGAVVPRDEVGDFARELVELLRDERRLAETGRAAARFARQWSDDESARNLGEFYRTLRLDQHGRGVSGDCLIPA